MNDSVFKQIASRTKPAPMPQDVDTESGEDDLGVFGYLRGVRDRALMLELRCKDGSVTAFGYSWLERIEFDPSDGITLRFAGQTVKITGRNLNVAVRPNVYLLNGLLRHRVPWVQEADEPTAMAADKRATIIERFEIT